MACSELPIETGWAVREAQKLGADEAEAYLVCASKYRFEIHNNSLSRSTLADTTSIGVRVSIGGRVAAAGGEINSEEDAREIIRKAIAIARTTSKDPQWPGFNDNLGCAPEKPATVDPQAASAGPEKLASILAEQAAVARESGARIVEAVLVTSYSIWEYSNSYGGPVRSEGTDVAYWLEARVDGEGRHATHGEAYFGRKLDHEKINRATRKSIDRARDALRAGPLKEPMREAIILEPQEAAGIIETLIVPAISASNIQKNRSPLTGKLGEQVLNPFLGIIDDPFLQMEAGSTCADDEGHPTTRKHVFQNGVFQQPLYNYYHAKIEGKQSTGNGFRNAPWSPTSPAPTNLIIKHRNPAKSIDSLIAEVEKGVLVATTIGSWLSNPASGQINATITLGYLISNGEIVRPIKGATLSGNIYEILGEKLIKTSEKEKECLYGICTGPILARGATIT